jgi:peptidyl-prolyl cis-trans isomerase B (cyclophilin B)
VAGRKQRQRELARARYQRRQARRAERDRRARTWTISVLAAVAVLAIAVGVFFIVRPSGSSSATASTTTPTASATATATPSASATASAAPVAEPAHQCTYTAGGSAARKVSLPPAKPDYTATYQATIHTNRGTIVIDLLNSKATCTVNSFVSLAAQKYFNNTHCHRLVTTGIFVLQCGDPSGTGSGTPGYAFDNENLTGAKYTAGTVAMANTGTNGTNGSQFFLVYKNSLSLPASYTPFGTIVSGLNIIQKVAAAGSDNSNATGDGHPKEKVEIDSVTIKKS